MLAIPVLAACLGLTGYGQLKDHSQQSGDFAILKGIKLAAIKIEFTGTREIGFLGKGFQCSTFAVTTREAVNFFDQSTNQYNNVIKDLAVHYELVVGWDTDNEIHDRLIENISSALQHPANGDKLDMGFVGDKHRYLLYDGRAKMPTLVWFDQRFIQVSFKRFGERRRDRIKNTETFWKDKIRFYSGDTVLPIKAMNDETRKMFMLHYNENQFTRH